MESAPILARSEADHAGSMHQLLPRGPAWEIAPGGTFERLLLALAAELTRLDLRMLDLLEEADPAASLETLADWERVAGLPDACTGTPDNIGERRVALVQKLSGVGGQRPADFVEVAARIGYEIDITEHQPLRVGFRPGDRAKSVAWAFAWTVTVQPFDGLGNAATSIAHFKVRDLVGTRVRGFGSLDLECVLRRAAPAHTQVIFAYAAEPEPAFWIDFTS